MLGKGSDQLCLATRIRHSIDYLNRSLYFYCRIYHVLFRFNRLMYDLINEFLGLPDVFILDFFLTKSPKFCNEQGAKGQRNGAGTCDQCNQVIRVIK